MLIREVAQWQLQCNQQGHTLVKGKNPTEGVAGAWKISSGNASMPERGSVHGFSVTKSRGILVGIAALGRGENSASIHQFLWLRLGRFFGVAGLKDMEVLAFISTSGI